MTVIGTDISHWRTVVDFLKMKDAGAEFCITKATEGIYYEDPTFHEYWPWMVSVGLVPGAFHFYIPWQDPIKQAEWFYNVVMNFGSVWGALPPTIDVEMDGIIPVHLKDHLDAVTDLFGVKPMIYTSARYWFDIPVGWEKEYLLWVASWGTAAPTMPRGWDTWTFHQYTNQGHGPTYGVKEATIDLNRFNGTIEDLYKLVVFDDEYPPPPPEEHPKVRVTSTTNLSIRDEPWGDRLGYAIPGSVWDELGRARDENDREWVQVAPNAWLAAWFTGKV